MRRFWAALRAAEMSAKQAAAMLAFTIFVSLPASAQAPGFVDPSQPESTRADSRNQYNTAGRLPYAAGRQPYSLGARRIHIVTEQEQRMEPSVADPPLARQIPRADNTLNAAVNANAAQLYADQTALGAFQQPSAFLRGKAKSSVRLLSEYDVELIVDSSQSMRKIDCPGGLSRWNWCGVQAKELSRQLEPYVPRGLTITAFARNYDVYHNATPDNIADLFDNPNFRGGTRLSSPLSDRLNEFFERRQSGSKPLLIAVITDGVPRPETEPTMVVTSLINATRRMKDQREVTVVFFQIGGRDKFGRAFLSFLDNGLVEKGARYDFVKAVPFEHLVQVGLPQALVESIQQFAARNGKGPVR